MRRCTLRRPSCGCWRALRLASIPPLLTAGLQALNRSAPHAITKSDSRSSFSRQYWSRLVRRVLRGRTLANLQLYGRAPSSVCQVCRVQTRLAVGYRGVLSRSRSACCASASNCGQTWFLVSRHQAHCTFVASLGLFTRVCDNNKSRHVVGACGAGRRLLSPSARTGSASSSWQRVSPGPPLASHAVCLGPVSIRGESGGVTPCSFCARMVFVRVTCRVFRRCVICFEDHSRGTFARHICVNPCRVMCGVGRVFASARPERSFFDFIRSSS